MLRWCLYQHEHQPIKQQYFCLHLCVHQLILKKNKNNLSFLKWEGLCFIMNIEHCNLSYRIIIFKKILPLFIYRIKYDKVPNDL